MEIHGLEQIKKEKRHGFFQHRFKTSIEEQTEYLSTNDKLSERFVLDVLIEMLRYTCEEMHRHNEDLKSEDLKQIVVFYTIDLLEVVFHIVITDIKFDTVLMLYAITDLLPKACIGEVKCNYLIDVIKKESPVLLDIIKPPLTIPPLELQVQSRTQDDDLDSIFEKDWAVAIRAKPEPVKPAMPVNSKKTKIRIANLLKRPTT